MNKFISASVWNFIANFSIRALSLLTYPFIVRNFTKGDISLFKALQALIAILIATIPFGTKHLFISSPKDVKKERWNVTFYVSLSISLLLILFVNIDKRFITSILGEKYQYINNFTLTFIIILSAVKSLLLISLMNRIDFKSISISLLIKQFLFYSSIIIFSILPSVSNVLIIILICSEVLEVALLSFFSFKKGVQFFPFKKIKLKIDKVTKKFLFFMGGEQIFNILALHFPSIFVIYVMGKNLAPEFQLPFYAINIPASLIMLSVAKVIFPYMSELRDNLLMRKTFLSVEFVITLITIPILICISIFNKEIVSLVFEEGWVNAAFAVKYFPLMVFVNVLNNPFTSIAAIKEKPQIALVYSLSLFIFRMCAIYFGYSLWGFNGSIILFIVVDVIIRLIRLRIDLGLIELRVKSFISNLKFNLICGIIFILSYCIFVRIIDSKFIAAGISFILWSTTNYYFEKDRIHKIILRIIKR